MSERFLPVEQAEIKPSGEIKPPEEEGEELTTINYVEGKQDGIRKSREKSEGEISRRDVVVTDYGDSDGDAGGGAFEEGDDSGPEASADDYDDALSIVSFQLGPAPPTTEVQFQDTSKEFDPDQTRQSSLHQSMSSKKSKSKSKSGLLPSKSKSDMHQTKSKGSLHQKSKGSLHQLKSKSDMHPVKSKGSFHQKSKGSLHQKSKGSIHRAESIKKVGPKKSEGSVTRKRSRHRTKSRERFGTSPRGTSPRSSSDLPESHLRRMRKSRSRLGRKEDSRATSLEDKRERIISGSSGILKKTSDVYDRGKSKSVTMEQRRSSVEKRRRKHISSLRQSSDPESHTRIRKSKGDRSKRKTHPIDDYDYDTYSDSSSSSTSTSSSSGSEERRRVVGKRRRRRSKDEEPHPLAQHAEEGKLSGGEEQDKKEKPEGRKKRRKSKKSSGGQRLKSVESESKSIIDEEDELMQLMKSLISETQISQDQVKEKEKERDKDKDKKEKKKKHHKKKKGGKKGHKGKKEKQLSPKEKARLDEEKRIQAEIDAMHEAEEERIRMIEERRTSMAKEKRDIQEEQMRIEQLTETLLYFGEMERATNDALLKEKEEQEWEQYLLCNGLPNVASVAEMNTYLYLWDQELEQVTIKQASHRTDEMHKLLEQLEDVINDPFDEPVTRQQDWLWIRKMFREHQQESMDFATYRLLRDIKNNLNRVNIQTADYRLEEKLFSLCLYLWVQLPTPMPNPRMPMKPRIHLELPEVHVEVLFPNTLQCELMAIRTMYLKYDHLTDTSATHERPAFPVAYTKDLLAITDYEWYVKLRYKWDNRIIKKSTAPTESLLDDGASILGVEPETEQELPPGQMPPIVPYQRLEPSASQVYLIHEMEHLNELKSGLVQKLPTNIVDLRKYVVLGGIYYINLFYQPPQPQGLVSFELFTTSLRIPCELEEAPFSVEYTPPPPIEPGVRRTPEEIEEDMLRQERELDELIFVSLVLPTHVFWMDTPMICQWDKRSKTWQTDSIYDYKHYEDKNYCTFRTGKFGIFGIASLRFTNLPFQAWEIRPEKDGTATLQITGSIITFEFHVKGHYIALTQLQTPPNNAFDEHIGKYYKLPRLKHLMKSVGLDIFPEIDTWHYVEGTCEKYWPFENHVYYNIAAASMVYNFTWSRWNTSCDYRSIVLQMRPYKFDRPKQVPYQTVLITPQRALYIECSEVSSEFSDTPIEGMHFYADLAHLIRSTGQVSAKLKMQKASLEVVHTLGNLYHAIRFLSFS